MTYEERWHLDRKVPIGIMFALVLQTLVIIIWATRLDSRVGVLETKDPAQDARIQKVEDIGSRVAVMEERQINTISRLDIQTKTMQEILAIVSKNRP
jgi:hypothetical protein